MMDDKQLDRMAKLVTLKVEMAKMGGVKPFDRIQGFIDQGLKDLVDEIEPPKPEPKPIPPVFETTPKAIPAEDLERRKRFDEEIAKHNESEVRR